MRLTIHIAVHTAALFPLWYMDFTHPPQFTQSRLVRRTIGNVGWRDQHALDWLGKASANIVGGATRGEAEPIVDIATQHGL